MNTYQTVKTPKWRIAGVFLCSVVAFLLIGLLYHAYMRWKFVDYSLLTGTPCTVPCWQNIVPGKTSSTETMQILKNNRYILQNRLQESGTEDSGGAIWRWYAPGQRTQSSISWQNGVIHEITIGLNYRLTMSQVIDKFGLPEAVNIGTGGTPEHWWWIIDLYYPRIGTQFTAYTQELDNRIKPSTQIKIVQLYVPISLEERITEVYGKGDYADEVVSSILAQMWPWRGYGNVLHLYHEVP